MPIRPVKYAIAGGIGAAAVASRWVDLRQGWDVPFRRVQDYIGLGGFIVGLADAGLEISPGGEVGETVAIASTPLLLISIYQAVKYFLKKSPSKTKGGKGKEARKPEELGFRLTRVPGEEVIRSY